MFTCREKQLPDCVLPETATGTNFVVLFVLFSEANWILKPTLYVHVPVLIPAEWGGTEKNWLICRTGRARNEIIYEIIAKTQVLICESQPKPRNGVGCDASRSGPFVEALTAFPTTKGKFQICFFSCAWKQPVFWSKVTTREQLPPPPSSATLIVWWTPCILGLIIESTLPRDREIVCVTSPSCMKPQLTHSSLNYEKSAVHERALFYWLLGSPQQ